MLRSRTIIPVFLVVFLVFQLEPWLDLLVDLLDQFAVPYPAVWEEEIVLWILCYMAQGPVWGFRRSG